MASSDGAGRGAATAGGAIDVEQLLGDRGRLLALAQRLAGGDGDDAEDLVQETWLRAWLHPPGDAARAGGWLRRIAQNLAARRHVRAAARIARERSVAAREAQPATDALVAQVELQRALADALLELDEPHRRVVLLRFWEQLPPRAIAAQLGLPVETVRTRQKRALARLRERLDARYGSRDSWGITAWTAGAAAMGSATKAAVAAGIVVAFGLGVAGWQLTRSKGRVEEPKAVEVAAPLVADEAPAGRDARDGGAGGEVALPVAERTATDATAASRLERVELRGSVVDAATRQPLAEARVVLHWFERSGDGDGTTFDRSLVVTTASDGRFNAIAEHVALDFFDGVVTRSGHARLAFSSQANQPNGKPTLVDFGRLALQVGARIVGRVVTLPDRAPVANAELHLCERASVSPGMFALDASRKVGVTRGDGRFELDERVAADPTATALYASGAGRIGFALFRTSGGVAQVEVELGLEAAGALEVTVVTPDGTPLPDARVIAYPTFPPFGARDYRSGLPPLPNVAREPWKSLFSGLTDEAGLVRFESLPEGRDDPLFDYPPQHGQSYQLHVLAEGWPRAYETVLVEHGQRREATVKLLPPTVHRIVGRVTSSGAPLAGAVVAFEGYEPATSDADGRYATPDRDGPIGWVDGKASATGHAPGDHGATREWVRSRTTTASAEESGVVAADGTPRAREEYVVDFELERAAIVSGRVIDEAGEPVADVTVRAEGLAEDGSRWVTLEPKGGATEADGRFEIEGISGNGGALSVDAPAGWLAPFPQRVRPGQRDVELVLQRLPASTARAIVKVRDAVSGEPATPVRAYAWPRSTHVRSRPGSQIGDGVVTIEALFPGDWELRVELADGRRALLPFRVATLDQQLALELMVGAETRVEGQLTLAGKPLRPKAGQRYFIWVRAATNNSDDGGHSLDAEGRPAAGLTGGVAVADAEGRFVMAQLLPGVAIHFWIEGEQHSASTTVVLQPGERRSLTIELAPAAAIEWRMGESLPPGQITLELARGDEPLCRAEQFPTDFVGAVVARSSRPAGPLRWRATWTASRGIPPEQRVATGTLDLAAAATATIDLAGFR